MSETIWCCWYEIVRVVFPSAGLDSPSQRHAVTRVHFILKTKRQWYIRELHAAVRILVRENLNFKGFEKKKDGHITVFCTGDLKRL